MIRETIREDLPDGFQRAEYLRDHGMVDMVVHRAALRETLIRLIALLGGRRATDATISLPRPSDGESVPAP